MLFWTYTLLKRREARIEEINWQSKYINVLFGLNQSIVSIVRKVYRPAADSSEKKFCWWLTVRQPELIFRVKWKSLSVGRWC